MTASAELDKILAKRVDLNSPAQTWLEQIFQNHSSFQSCYDYYFQPVETFRTKSLATTFTKKLFIKIWSFPYREKIKKGEKYIIKSSSSCTLSIKSWKLETLPCLESNFHRWEICLSHIQPGVYAERKTSFPPGWWDHWESLLCIAVLISHWHSHWNSFFQGNYKHEESL